LPILNRLAHGRLPRSARSLVDTNDIVLITLERALDHVATFESRHEGAFLAYLRRALLNRIRDEARRAARRPAQTELKDQHPAPDPSPLEEMIGLEALDRYEAALNELSETQQEEVVLKLEMGLSYAEIAEAVGSPSPGAVRMSISRALALLAKRMKPRGDRLG
jgi:RNA polymerase sigma-70 factor (ECF subfamily)